MRRSTVARTAVRTRARSVLMRHGVRVMDALVAALRCLYVDVYVCHMYPQSAYECFPSAWTVSVRLAGVLMGGNVQREHRQVGHGARDYVEPGMCRSAVACNVLRSGARFVLRGARTRATRLELGRFLMRRGGVCGDAAGVQLYSRPRT
jgi:hypothetical protein